MTELAPCPFCGSTPSLDHNHDITFVLCAGCDAVVSFRRNIKGSAVLRAYAKRAALPQGAPVRDGDGNQYVKVT